MTAILEPILEKLGTPVHGVLFPYAWGATLHAARISLAYQGLYAAERERERGGRAAGEKDTRAEEEDKLAGGERAGEKDKDKDALEGDGDGEGREKAREKEGEMNWPTYLAGYLVMAWGGTFLSHLLLGLHAPPLLSLGPWINYLSVNILLTLLFKHTGLPSLRKGMGSLDAALVPLDALLRANAVVNTVGLLSSSSSLSPIIPLNSTSAVTSAATLPLNSTSALASPTFHAILGASASAGGSILASSLRTYTPHWAFRTPPFLLGAGPHRSVWISAADVWAGAVVGVLAGVVKGTVRVDLGGYIPERALNGLNGVLGGVGGLLNSSGVGAGGKEVVSAKVVAMYVFAGVFAWRVWMLQRKN